MNSRQGVPLQEIQRNLAFHSDTAGKSSSKKPFDHGTPLSLFSQPDFSDLAAPPTMSTADLLNGSNDAELSMDTSHSPSDIWRFSDIKKSDPTPHQPSIFSLQPSTPQDPIQNSTPTLGVSSAISGKAPEPFSEPHRATAAASASVTPSITPAPAHPSVYTIRPNRATGSWTDLLMWNDFIKTLIVAVAGALVLAFVTFLGVGDHGVTPLTGASCCGLALVTFHFLGSLFNSRHSEWASLSKPANVKLVADSVASMVQRAALLHDRLILSDQPKTMLWIALSLWGTMFLGSVMSFRAILWVAYVSVFTLPVAWRVHGAAAKHQASALLDAAHKKAAGLGVNRRITALLQAAFSASVFLNLSLPHRIAIVIVGTVAARCQLNPAEVESIRAKAEEITMSVQKQPTVSRFIAACTPHRKMF